MNIKDLVRPNKLEMTPYSSARDEYTSDGSVSLLAANENPFESDYNRYPDPYQKELKSTISKLKEVEVGKIFLGNGSDEAIDLILRIFCEPGEDSIITTDTTYGMYQVAASIQNVGVYQIPLSVNFDLPVETILKTSGEDTKVLFICNPNNPTGNSFPKTDIDRLIENFNGIVVIDEAYIDFTKEESYAQRINQYSNLIVLQTFSKAWGLAGLRLGMAFTNELIMNLFNKVKAPYNLSSLTQTTAQALIENNKQSTLEKLSIILRDRTRLKEALGPLLCVEQVFNTDTNFLLVRFKDHERAYQTLTEHKVIVRDRSHALHCEKCLRITVGTSEENNRVISILESL